MVQSQLDPTTAGTAAPLLPLSRLVRSARAGGERAPEARALARDLERSVEGDVLFDAGSRGLYAQDASNYFEVPLGVVIPRSRQDVIATVAACRAHGAPVLSRTGGTALAGQTCNQAVVIDFTKHVNGLLELDVAQRRACVEPGLVCDELVHAAQPHGLTWGPKPATHDHCCFGGMLANNCGGMEAQWAGIAVHQVEEMDVLLYDGTQLRLGWMTPDELERACERPGREGEIHRSLRALRDRVGSLVRERYPQIPRRVSGFNLDQLLPGEDGRINLARALVGSEGTCAVMLQATVRLLPLPAAHTVVAIGFEDVYAAADAVPAVLESAPMICEGMDHELIENVRRKGSKHVRYLELLPKGAGFLLVKLGGESMDEARDRAEQLRAQLRDRHGAIDSRIYDDERHQEGLWKVRESGLGATAFVPGKPDAWPGWEDSAVPPERLGDYLRELRQLFRRYGYNPALYGHFGQGLVHCRAGFELASAGGIETYKEFARAAADLCVGKFGGSLSGEHGDGQSRGWLLERMFGPELVAAFAEFKAIWDPDGKMNPGKVVDPKPVDSQLRLGADYDPWEPETHFRFPQDGGSFARAALRCVGVGKCRRHDAAGDAPSDVMCPSFMVTGDEKHSTRGRAHLLWEMMRGGDSPIDGGFRDEHVKDALDLCLSCKGCKGDCPVNVDVATYKAEFLAHYWKGRIRPRYAYAFGFIDKWARLASFAPGLVNLLTHARPTSWLAKLAAGMTPGREAPRFAGETFVAWYAKNRELPSDPSARRVVLFPDTFNNHFHPETARAALEVLEAAGYQVVVPSEPVCCGRPLYDYGFLDAAPAYLERVMATLRPWIDQGLPIVVLEPSCASVFRDELASLMPTRVEAARLREQTKLLSELLAEQDHWPVPKLHGEAVVQGHCHHKSVLGYDAEQAIFERMELDAELLSSGCCGMAGSFGFERERSKQQVADACGERVLFPAVRAAEPETLLVADGFSCRTAIAQGTGRRALHLAEVLKLALDHGPGGPPAGHVEASAPDRALPERRAAGALACVLAGAGLAWLIVRGLRAQGERPSVRS